MAFYHELILNDRASTARLYYNKDSGNRIEIGRAPLRSPFMMSVDITWVQGTDIVSAFMEGLGKAGQATANAFKFLREGYTKITNPNLSQSAGATSYLNDPAESQAKIMTASDAYAKFGGSDTSIGIPELEFIFINTGNGNKFMSDATRLLNHTLPYITARTTENGEQKAGSKYFKVEVPPNDYRSHYAGFDSRGLQRDLHLELGEKQIPHVLPTRVEVEFSQTGWITDSVWRPHYIKIRVGLRLAMKVTTTDMSTLLGLSDFHPNVQDSEVDKFAQQQIDEAIKEDKRIQEEEAKAQKEQAQEVQNSKTNGK